jgi:hypothetical protein
VVTLGVEPFQVEGMANSHFSVFKLRHKMMGGFIAWPRLGGLGFLRWFGV